MSWRYCQEGLACRCRIGCLGPSFISNEGELTMKTILVPTQNIPAMKSTLETAVLLAQRTGAYVEGVPLWYGVPEFVVAEQASTFSIETYRARRHEETAGKGTRFASLIAEDGNSAVRNNADLPSLWWVFEVA